MRHTHQTCKEEGSPCVEARGTNEVKRSLAFPVRADAMLWGTLEQQHVDPPSIWWVKVMSVLHHGERPVACLPGVCFSHDCFSIAGRSVERREGTEEAMPFFQRITLAFHILPTIGRDESNHASRIWQRRIRSSS